jgi:uncharacterized RDD family membrane protein YckC
MASSYGEVVTGEAVTLDLQPAAFASRAVSGLIDVLAQIAALIGFALALGVLLASADQDAGTAVGLAGSVAIIVGYPLVMETLTRGRTLGKLAMGLRTVRDDGGPIRFRQALIRALVEVPEVWLLAGSPALICSLISERGKRLGDLLAGTYVVRERGVSGRGPAPQMPYPLAGWAHLADIGRIPDPLAVAARQFLGRAPGLHAESRAAMGVALANELSAFVAPRAPVGTPPEAFLAAVLAERRQRDLVRLARERETLRRLTARR